MKTIIQISTATIFAVSLFSLAAPAFAMNTREAITACDANPACRMVWGKDNDGVTISVGGKTIDCPKKNGSCTVVRTLGNIGQGSNAQILETNDAEAIQ